MKHASLVHRALLALLLSLPAFGQSSSLKGEVTDGQGAAVPEVVVTITNLDTAATRKTVSTATGSYVFLQVPPGPYKLEAQRPGFRTLTQQVRLQIDVPSTVNLALEVGQVNETINVSEEAIAINTTNATVGNAFTEVQVRQLPLQTRNVVELLSLQPGVTANGEVLGAKRDQNNVTLDGVDVNDQQSAGMTASTSAGLNAALPVPLDSVQEFRVTIAGQGADQGRSAGGQVSLVTKSGSNNFHGSLYDFNRNKSLAANDWFSNRSGLKREALIRNQYGASLGGRIIRDRAFFFVNWEDRKDRSASAQSRNVPTETLKAGIVQYRTSAGVQSLSPAEVTTLDPRGLGYNPAMRAILNQYPAANDLQAGSDRGLNFGVFRFNAPFTRNDRAYVAKMDFNLDKAAKHTLMLRGTLGQNARDQVLAQFPGQDAAAKNLDNSKGLAARYTAVLSSNVVNVFSYGFTRLGIAQSGTPGTRLTFDSLSDLQNYTRGFGRIIPTTNLVNDTTWTKGAHTIQAGINFRLIQNDRNSFANSYPTYGFSRNTLRGLGADITDALLAYTRTRSGNPALTLTETQPAQRALGNLFGLMNNYSATYNFGADGVAVPFGQPILRSFGTREYEFYVQDSWKARRDLTLTAGLRYGLYQVPYERNGVQVVPTTGLDVYFAQRIGASLAGVSGAAQRDASLTFALAGPANNGPGWYKRDTNNFAPRFSLAYAPVSDTFWGKLFGKGSVIRAGASMLYDRYGSDMVLNFDSSGSPGLASPVTQPRNTDFTDSVRFGATLPALPVAPAAKFPFTPSTIVGGFGSYSGVFPDLVAPYSYLLNLTYARPLPGKLVLETGYVGRLARKSLVKLDVFQPLTQFRDSKSGQTWAQAAGVLRDRFEGGVTPAQVRANPSLMAPVPFIENMFPGAAGRTFPGSATANYFFTTYGTYGGSDLDALNDMDRERNAAGQCISVLGCNTFFANQNAGNLAWTNAGRSSFHGGQLTLRRAVSQGWGFDFNYTLSHSIDLASTAESAAGVGGGVIQDSFNPRSFRGSSDFDIRHNITANGVVELPFGKGKPILGNARGWADHIVGGWQVSTLWRFRTGQPLNITNGGIYPTNYLNSALGQLRPGASLPENTAGYNANGNPALFRTTNAAAGAFMGQYPGTSGTRALIRGAGMSNFDLSLGKFFIMPWSESHRVQLRGEAFNAFNNVNFTDANTSLANPSTFGQFTAVMPARVIQLALRYEF
ncbi:MAG: carboxypeptidase-like regulatory domain-containing protein [Bryobacteraceae bacterium]|nr:carboxypeptidase-like regulatory domain-containing protein [Bryobacteraceae bacterium]